MRYSIVIRQVVEDATSYLIISGRSCGLICTPGWPQWQSWCHIGESREMSVQMKLLDISVMHLEMRDAKTGI